MPKASMGSVTTIEASVEVFHRDDTEHYLLITGELFGPYPTEEAAVLDIGPCLLGMD